MKKAMLLRAMGVAMLAVCTQAGVWGAEVTVVKKEIPAGQSQSTASSWTMPAAGSGSAGITTESRTNLNLPENAQQEPAMTAMPLLIHTRTAEAVPTVYQAQVEGQHVWVPLQVVEQLSRNRVQTDKHTHMPIMAVPDLRAAGDMIYIDDYSKSQNIRLPVMALGGINYIDIRSAAPIVGVSHIKSAEGIILSTNLGPAEKPVRQEITEPLAWVFDPQGRTGNSYEQKLGEKGTSVISPSWFQLGRQGLIVDTKVSQNYIQNYLGRSFRVWPLITNQFDSALTSDILNDHKVWPIYAQELIKYALVYDFDGYNFDFENVKLADKDKLTAFVHYLAGELRKYNIYSSIDVTGYSDSPNWSLVYDRKKLGQSVDYMVLMAYDQTWASSKTPGPVASLPWVEQNLKQLVSEVPSRKVVLGIPFYMRIWTETTKKLDPKGLTESKTPFGPTTPIEGKALTAAQPTAETGGLTVPKAETGDLSAPKAVQPGSAVLVVKEGIAAPAGGNEQKAVQANAKANVNPNTKANVNLDAKASVNPKAKTGIQSNTNANTSSGTAAAMEKSEFKSKTLTIADSHAYVEKYGHDREKYKWDDQLKLYHLSFTDQDGKKQIWMEDSRSLTLKLELIKKYNIAGFAAWRKGFEDTPVQELIRKTVR